jgi:superfamily II DNA or RNA helicase
VIIPVFALESNMECKDKRGVRMSKNEALAEIDSLRPIYFPNECDISKELFYPVASSADKFDCMTGYFSSEMLAELSFPLACFYSRGESSSRLLMSPALSEKDKEALFQAYESNENMLPYLFGSVEDIRHDLKYKTLEVLKALVSAGKLDLKVVLMKEGMFHAKVWLFDIVGAGKVAIHGSSNATQNGLIRNFEQITVTKGWAGKDASLTCEELQIRFDSFWNAKRADSITLPLNKRTIGLIDDVSKERDIKKTAAEIIEKFEEELRVPFLTVPSWLNFKTGNYSHQECAVGAWIKARGGILAIATGGGKTLTSLVCMAKALSGERKALLLIVVPKVPLVDQWCEDVEKFGVRPLNTSGLGTVGIVSALNQLRLNFKYSDGHAVVVMTHDAIKNNKVQAALEKIKFSKGIIADEVHNLGTFDMENTSLNTIGVRLGLSATPVRQYDEAGTQLLYKYFGDTVYEFGLDQAIGKCLVPYNYYPHLVSLDEDELDEWLRLNEKIKKMGWTLSGGESNSSLEILLVKRRKILECAENKLVKLKSLLAGKQNSEISKCLVFCTDKDPAQLDSVNGYLLNRGISFHQVTSEESGNSTKMRQIKSAFSNNELAVLTSKRVLDEGFNVPQIETAYLLSSNTVRRQWIQRLGRVLRLSPETNKKIAYVHDFVVIPPMSYGVDEDLKKIINSEFERVKYFTELSNNSIASDGGLKVMDLLIGMMEKS